MRTVEVAVVSEEAEIIREVKCDLCGTIGRDPAEGTNAWHGEIYDVDQVRVSYLSGMHWPEGDRDVKLVRFDLCPACFMEKLVPWMKSQGAIPFEGEHSNMIRGPQSSMLR